MLLRHVAKDVVKERVIPILIHSDKTHFQYVFVLLLRRVAKEATLSWHTRYDFNAANFRCHSHVTNVMN